MEGIAVAAALSLVEKVLSLLDQVPFQKTLRNQVEEVRNSLGTMQAYLRDMEGREGRSWVLKERMKQVRDIAYDTENVLDEIMLHVTYRYHRHRITKKTHELFHNLAHWIPLHNTMSSKMKGIKEKIVGITASDQLGGGGGGGDGGGSSRCVWSEGPNSRPRVEHFDHIVSLQPQHGNEDDIVGFEKPREELICQLRGTEPRKKTMIISVVGPCGSGKSLLAKNVYGITRSRELFDCYAWVRVSRSPKIEQILQSMLEQFCSSTKEPTSNHESAAVTPAKLWKYLQQKRYVVFLDDIWSIEDWENIKDALPNHSSGSRIVVTTRKLDVASFCSDEHHTHNLTCLSGPEAWKLFCKKAFPANKCPPELEDWSKKIMKRCEGNPHAIVAVGTLLSKKQQNPTVWKRMHDSLVSEVGTSSSLSIINKLLASYKDLPWNLQSCFLYFSIFPEDHSVESGRLVRLWIAEGFVKKTRGKTLEEVAEDYLNGLVGSNLVHATRNFDGRVKDCRVLNFVLEFIIQKSEEENLVSVIAETADTRLSEKFRRLSIHNPSCITQISRVFRSNSVLSSSVRSTFFFKMDKLSNPSVITDMLGLPSFNLLGVLDFRDAPLYRFPEVIVRLTLLRYLSFRRTQIENIPKSIKKLSYLETLDLKQTGITQLPKKINQLHNLRHLLLCRDRGKNHVWLNPDEGVAMVEGIGALTNLQTLSLVKPDKNHKIFKELGDLTQLRKLGLIDLKREDGKDLCASIQRMENLSTLDVRSTGKQEPLDLADYHMPSHTCPCPHLQHLYLKGHLPEFPKWISSLTNLFRIRLKWSGLTSNPLVALQDLPNLMELQMDDAFTGEELVFETGGFKKLRMLHIEQFDHLHTVVVEEGSMPVLQKLTLRNCGQLKMLPLGINNLTRLKELLLYGMPTEFISGLQKGSEDREMVKHIDVIHSFILQDDGSWSLDQNLS